MHCIKLPFGPLVQAYQVLAALLRYDGDQDPLRRAPVAGDMPQLLIFIEAHIHMVCRLTQRRLAQCVQIPQPEKMGENLRNFFRLIDGPALQPVDQGRRLDIHNNRLVQYLVGKRFAHMDPRDTLQMLEIYRRINVDAMFQQLHDILIAFLMFHSRCITAGVDTPENSATCSCVNDNFFLLSRIM